MSNSVSDPSSEPQPKRGHAPRHPAAALGLLLEQHRPSAVAVRLCHGRLGRRCRPLPLQRSGPGPVAPLRRARRLALESGLFRRRPAARPGSLVYGPTPARPGLRERAHRPNPLPAWAGSGCRAPSAPWCRSPSASASCWWIPGIGTTASLLGLVFLLLAALLMWFFIKRRALFLGGSREGLETPTQSLGWLNWLLILIGMGTSLALIAAFVAAPVTLPQTLGAPAIVLLGFAGVALFGGLVLTYAFLANGQPAGTAYVLVDGCFLRALQRQSLDPHRRPGARSRATGRQGPLSGLAPGPSRLQADAGRARASHLCSRRRRRHPRLLLDCLHPCHPGIDPRLRREPVLRERRLGRQRRRRRLYGHQTPAARGRTGGTRPPEPRRSRRSGASWVRTSSPPWSPDSCFRTWSSASSPTPFRKPIASASWSSASSAP